jgi:toxin YoeB
MRLISFDPEAFDQYNSWASDKKAFVRLQRLIKETALDPFEGIGKPEPLRGDLQGLWSWRIN